MEEREEKRKGEREKERKREREKEREKEGKKERKNVSTRLGELGESGFSRQWRTRVAGRSDTSHRELRGSGACGYIIKKQETSSFSPALVKILNGDFMLPTLVACTRSLARAATRAYIVPALMRGFPFRVPHIHTHISYVSPYT